MDLRFGLDTLHGRECEFHTTLLSGNTSLFAVVSYYYADDYLRTKTTEETDLLLHLTAQVS